MDVILIRKDVYIFYLPTFVADSKEPSVLPLQEEAWSLYTVLGECTLSLPLSLSLFTLLTYVYSHSY